jgi:branched-chain amino acid transport system substrate-binding protein
MKKKMMFNYRCSFLFSIILFAVAVVFSPFNAYAAPKTIKIGVSAPLKFAIGQHIAKGAEMAADEINAAGGVVIKGERYNYEVIPVDDNCFLSVTDAVSAIEKLITVRKVNFVLGGYSSQGTLAQQEVMADNKVIYLATGGTHPQLNERIAKNYDRYKYWFRIWVCSTPQAFNYFAQVSSIVEKVKSELGIPKPKVALLMDKAIWIDPIGAMAKKLFPAMGCEVIGEWRPSVQATNLTAEFSAIKSAGAHMIFQVSAGPIGHLYGKQWGELKIPACLIGVNVEANDFSHWDGTRGMCNYEETSGYPRVSFSKKSLPFWDKFVKRYNEPPMYTASINYDVLFYLKDAIEKAGTLNSDALIPFLEKTDYLGTIGRVAFTPRNHPRPHDLMVGPDYTFMFAGQWRDGKFLPIWPNGKDIHPAIVAAGFPGDWKKIKLEGAVEYQVPPWVKEFWKDKK